MGEMSEMLVIFTIEFEHFHLSAASIAESLRDAKAYGFDVTMNNSFNWLALKEKRDAYIARLNGIYEKNLGNDNVAYLKGFASLVDTNTVRVQNGAESSEIKAKNILITVGKREFRRPMNTNTHLTNTFYQAVVQSFRTYPVLSSASARMDFSILRINQNGSQSSVPVTLALNWLAFSMPLAAK